MPLLPCGHGGNILHVMDVKCHVIRCDVMVLIYFQRCKVPRLQGCRAVRDGGVKSGVNGGVNTVRAHQRWSDRGKVGSSAITTQKNRTEKLQAVSLCRNQLSGLH